jgi:hypothetical protein
LLEPNQGRVSVNGLDGHSGKIEEIVSAERRHRVVAFGEVK